MTQYYCNICKKPIPKDVYDYSMRHHNRPLCMTHQKQNKTSYSDKKNYDSYTPKPRENSKITPQAMMLYNALRKRGIRCKLEAYDGYKHVDISIEWAGINIEVDGKHHLYDSKQLYADLERDSGSYDDDDIKTIRVPNFMIEENVEALADSIAKTVRRKHREDDDFF